MTARPSPSNLVATAVALALSLATSVAAQAASTDEKPISEVVVTATRIEASLFNVPAAISRVEANQLRENALGINLADDVATVPGLLARNRNNYAQDQQISIRGIGANSAFGIRGVRVYQDGIPATGPDGQGQVSQFNLDSAERVEILRGPFSALYGNSSGGVIQLFTSDGQDPNQLRSSIAYGSYDTFRAGVGASGTAGALGYNAAFTHFTVDGYRDHSSARNESFNGKFDYAFNDNHKLTLITNIVSRPDAEDPLGLTPAQFAADPDRNRIRRHAVQHAQEPRTAARRTHLRREDQRRSVRAPARLLRTSRRSAVPLDSRSDADPGDERRWRSRSEPRFRRR